MKKHRKDMEKMGAAMKKVRNPRDWTPPGNTTPEQKAQHGREHIPKPPSDPYGVKKWKATPQSEREKEVWKNRKVHDEGEAFNKQFYKGYGGIEMVGHPGEYLMGGGAIKGFSTAKTLLGKAFEKGSKYVVKSAQRSSKGTSIGSNSL